MPNGLLYSVSWDTTTKTLSFTDKAGNTIYSCIVDIAPAPIVDDPTKPLYLLSKANGSTIWLEGITDYVDDNTFETSPDGTTWTGLALGSANAITLNRGDGVYIRAVATRTGFPTSSFLQVPVCIMMTGTIEAYHNVNSMLSPSFSSITDLSTIGNNAFQGLFAPNTTSDTAQVRNTALTKAPLLPATTLAPHCYNSMFLFCTNLTTPPVLPCTDLTNASFCYNNMFNQSGLTTAPALPATTLTRACYQRMFKACPFTTAPALPATTLANDCYKYMFEVCTGLTKAPDLPATTLKDSCYNHMFTGCSSLSEIHVAATNISAFQCLTSWLAGVAATGDFYCDPNTSFPTDSPSGIPQGWQRLPLT